jgi:hypothetical protein
MVAHPSRRLDDLRETVQHELRGEPLLTPEVDMVEPGRLPS